MIEKSKYEIKDNLDLKIFKKKKLINKNLKN